MSSPGKDVRSRHCVDGRSLGQIEHRVNWWAFLYVLVFHAPFSIQVRYLDGEAQVGRQPLMICICIFSLFYGNFILFDRVSIDLLGANLFPGNLARYFFRGPEVYGRCKLPFNIGVFRAVYLPEYALITSGVAFGTDNLKMFICQNMPLSPLTMVYIGVLPFSALILFPLTYNFPLLVTFPSFVIMSAVRFAADAYESITIVNRNMIPATTKHLFITTLLKNLCVLDETPGSVRPICTVL